jgi:cell division protein FtsB
MAPYSKLFTTHVFPLRPPRTLPQVNFITRDMARRGLILLTLIGLLLFLYLAEISQVSTTAIDIEALQREYLHLQEENQELERQIAALESPETVLNYVAQHEMKPVSEPVYLDLNR